ncbi:acetyl-CoA carboxylase carboxyltransferase subunit alpha [Candidatus Velamenicoccus archaeovorus]|uniref:Acetyl-coenzyme A carboxylase carboxyl transferase subunit alpha n=1 Tax=Velamenicoccus archaeovorus TaxID=1930593 RepID=A0A410P635_VELA1|nr:acetyl-CoA carboxylase carboxyltransferase subunit alpha [Candidatus Velamenicoccus archaeovorus]QAT17655.1 acetyl-CoA carboxylase carboxyltransferase subunit alpha [Candidatus Velamenicoccus archaeovorus]
MIALDFEKPIVELEKKIRELRSFTEEKHIDLSGEVKRLEEKLERLRRDIYGRLTPWQRVQISRHPHRPYTLDYIQLILKDFLEIHGDRSFRDDRAIVSGFARLDGQKIIVMGHQKGRDTKENLVRTFGCAHPEGYRKALRVMELAQKFDLPILIFIDTPGAYPGIGAEERGQAQAVAWNLKMMSGIRTPIVAVVIGEGGSGGALGIGVADRVCVLENAYYSVISPEGCAAILWKSSTKAPEAAEALKLTAQDLLKFGVIDEIVKEPLGGAHRDPEEAAKNVKACVKKYFIELMKLSEDQLVDRRYQKFRAMGQILEEAHESR